MKFRTILFYLAILLLLPFAFKIKARAFSLPNQGSCETEKIVEVSK